MAKKPGTAQPELSAATRIAVLVGPELFLQSEYVAKLAAALAAAHGKDGVDTIRFDGATTPAADILDECRTFGLMQQHKLVVVDNADQAVKDANRGLFERYAEHPSEQATLVLRCQKWNKGKTLDGLIEAHGAFVACETVTDDLAARWIIKRAALRYGVAIDPAAAELLVERIGPDLSRLDSEAAKLGLWAMDEQGKPARPITRDDVADMVGASREEDAWSLQAAIIEGGRTGDPSAALAHLRTSIEITRESPALLSIVCMDLGRKLYLASAGLAAGMRGFDVMRAARLWGKSADPMLAAAKALGPATSARILARAVEADARFKSGLGTDRRNLECFIVSVAVSGR